MDKRSLLFYGVALATVVTDQVTKAIARTALADGNPHTVIPGFFNLQLSFNTGAAFGMMPEWAPLLIIVTLVAIFAIFRLRGKGPEANSLTIGLALLLGGAVGNLIDRVFSPAHAVTDFLSFYVNTGSSAHSWPTFNIADAAVVVGALLMLFYVYVLEKRREDAA